MRNWDAVPENTGDPDFENLAAVLRCERPKRPTLFEFFLNADLYARLADDGVATGVAEPGVWLASALQLTSAFRNAGYDYVTLSPPGFRFPYGEADQQETRSLNEGAIITDRQSFESYPWPDPDDADWSALASLSDHLGPGMKVVVPGPMGVLENVIRMVGYDRLCYLIADDEALASDIFSAVGERLVRYYRRAAACPVVGAVIGNDDWGFKTQTLLSPADMRRFVFPWHTRLVEEAHAEDKPAILHSCGNLEKVMGDVVDRMQYDGKHSFEDAIKPVEEAYEEYGERIAILGGIDVDFVVREEPEVIHQRSLAMVERTAQRGSFALGTGNSVPAYVPDAHYFALIDAALRGHR